MPHNNGDQTAEPLGAFTCNLCGENNVSHAAAADRETATCSSCHSSMRFRAIILTLSRALFGLDLPLPHFPKLKTLRGLGISDSEVYASRLEKIFTYTNTFYHREPFLDLTAPGESESATYDFIICSEVLEHVPDPVDKAFHTLSKLLKPSGVLILTVPYATDEANSEHYAGVAESGLAQVGGKTVLVGRLASGEYRVFDNLTFHGGPGSTLEHRLFSETELRERLSTAGFPSVQFDPSGSRKFGVTFPHRWSLPITARRGAFALTPSSVTELVEQLSEDRALVAAERNMLASSRWLRLGKTLGIGPRLAKRNFR